MNNEPQQIALRYKGEDYADCTAQLINEGFQPKGFNEWYSPTTGNTYRFVLANSGGYVTRVELAANGDAELISTEFCDRKLAIKRFDAENSKPEPYSDDEVKQGVIHALYKFSPSQFTRTLQQASREGDAFTDMLYSRLGVDPGERISVKQYLFVSDGADSEVIAVCSDHRRYDRPLLRTLAVGSKKLYIYRALRLPEDMIDSLLSRVRLERLIGADEVQKMRSPNVC